MNYLTKVIASPLEHSTDCAVVFCANKTLFASAKCFDEKLGSTLSSLLTEGDIKDNIGESAWVPCPPDLSSKRVLLVNVGKVKEKELPKKDLQKLLISVATCITKSAAKNTTLYFDELLTENDESNQWLLQQLATQIEYASYRYTATKSKNDDKVKLGKICVALDSKANVKSGKELLTQGKATGTGINFARELGNLPPNICTPSYLSKLADEMAEAYPALSTKALSEKQMEKLGMGAFISVSKGSDEGGKLIVMEYRGASKSSDKSKKISDIPVLVGKGITFDTGGISLKPGAGMDEMKFDMCGAASVFGTIKALAEMEAKIDVVGLVAAAENMPSGHASKPGDVVTSMSGQTIEILNTDAEGRLVLCDTLTYAEKYNPRVVVDVATLTGACVIALGNHATGLYSNNQKLAEALLESGETTLDRAWRMPLWDEYQKQLDSNFADMANIGGREAGSVTAACFLSRYAKNFPWAHLDIAGTAWKSGGAKGATGRPVSLLVNYLLNAGK